MLYNKHRNSVKILYFNLNRSITKCCLRGFDLKRKPKLNNFVNLNKFYKVMNSHNADILREKIAL